eukprot:gene12540-8964_t
MRTSLTPGLASRTKALEVNVKIRSGEEQPLYQRLSLLSDFVNIQSLALHGTFLIDDSEDERFFLQIKELFVSLRSLKLRIRNFCMTDRNPKLSETIISTMRNLKSLSLNVMHWDSHIFQTLFVRTSNAFPSLESLYIGPIEYPHFISGIVATDDKATKCRKFIDFCDLLTMAETTDRCRGVHQLPMPNLRSLSGDFLAVYPLLRIYAPQLLSIGLEEECDLCTMLHVSSLRNAMLKDLCAYWCAHPHRVPAHLHSFSLWSNRKCHPDATKVNLRSFLRKSIGSLRHLNLEGLAYDIRVMIEWLKSPEDAEEVNLPGSVGRSNVGCFAQLRTFTWHPMDITEESSSSISAQHNSAAVANPFGLSSLFRTLGLNAPLLEEVSFSPRNRAILPLAAIGTSDMMQLRRLSLRHAHTLYDAPRQEFVMYRSFVHLQSVDLEDIGTYISEHSLLQVLPFWPQLEEFRLVQRSHEQTVCQTPREAERAVQAAFNVSGTINEYFRRYFGVECPDQHLRASPTAAAASAAASAAPTFRDRSAAPKTTNRTTTALRTKSGTKSSLVVNHGYYFLLYHGALSSGWMSGSLHAITGSDHLASILPVILSQRWQAGLMYGLVWGFGHGLTSFVLGVTALGMKSMVISPSSSTSLFLHKYRYFGDFVSAATILIIGLMGLYENSLDSTHSSEESPSNPSPANDEFSLSESSSTRATDEGSSSSSSKKKNVSTKYTAVCYDSVKLVSVFVHGAALGLSLDGLPSLTPAVVLASNHVLVFLSSYWLSTAVIMGIASSLVAEVSRFLTKHSKQRHVDSLPLADVDVEAVSGRSGSSVSEPAFEEPDYENKLARVASWAACLIGFGYLALSLMRLYLQVYFASFSLTELAEGHPYPFYWMQVLSVPMAAAAPSNNDGLPTMNDGTGGVSTAATLMSGFVDDATAHHLEYHQTHGIPLVDILWTVFSLISVVVALVKGLGSDVIYNIVVHGSSRKYANQQ